MKKIIIISLAFVLIAAPLLYGMWRKKKKTNYNMLKNIKLPESVAWKVTEYWNRFYFKNREEDDLLENNLKKSKFFKFNISDWTSYHFSFKMKKSCNFNAIKIGLAFSDVEKHIYPFNNPLLQDEDLNDFVFDHGHEITKKFILYKNLYNVDKLSQELQNEIIKGLAHRYKIHLQVKPEYIISFVNDFIKLITQDDKERCKNINSFKVAKRMIKGYNTYHDSGKQPKEPMSIVVVYIKLIPGTKEEKTSIIKPIIQAIIERYAHISKEVEFPLAPRFNIKIKDFIYLAGGDGDNKTDFKRNIKFSEERGIEKLPRNLVFTEDFAFLRNYEIKAEDLLKK